MKKQVSAAVFHLTSTKNSMQASARIAKYVSQLLKIPLYDGTTKPDQPLKSFDIAMLVNSPTGFADPDWRWYVSAACVSARKFVFIQNDYKMAPPSQVQRCVERSGKTISRIMWTTVPDRMKGYDPRSCYINWNKLTWNNQPLLPTANRCYSGVLYYGALRKGRENTLLKYFSKHTLYPVSISAPMRSHKAFTTLLGSVQLIPPLPIPIYHAIAMWPATVYVEDNWSHKHYCSPANRFYECLSAGIMQFIDIDAVSTLQEAGYSVPEEFKVHEATDVAKYIPYRVIEITKIQQRLWNTGRNYTAELDTSVRGAWKELIK